MKTKQSITLQRRRYNQWVANQTLEDYALRFTAVSARKSTFRVGNTALGAISFLACEAIGGLVTLTYGFSNAAAAIVAVSALMFVLGTPITYYATKFGVDVDLLTRGAGFGYLGSTITSLIYASFTFLLFSIEASIMSSALQMCLGIPLPIAHVISSLVVIPIAVSGIRGISRMQITTQPVWLILQFVPLLYFGINNKSELIAWTAFSGAQGRLDGSISLVQFGAAASVLMSLLPQIGEQIDYLRFLPSRTPANNFAWWSAMITTGPGWVLIGAFKLLAGSFLTFLALKRGIPFDRAAQPAEVYRLVFLDLFDSQTVALGLTGLLVITCQIKINVTNAYAGSIAWSNFFSRLSHNHPGRVVWLVFNVLLALLLMEIGIFRVVDSALGLYAIFAASWMGALAADLMINKPLGLSPPQIEFKRAYLYDINPVGAGAMGFSVVVSTLMFFGLLGPTLQSLSAVAGLIVAFMTAPVIAWVTKGRYYIARPDTGLPEGQAEIRCSICENSFDRMDMAYCPAYSAPICSLCCTLEARCHDMCKPGRRLSDQISRLLDISVPKQTAWFLKTRMGQFLAVFLLFNAIIAALLAFVFFELGMLTSHDQETIGRALGIVFLNLLILSGVAAWLLVLAHESRRAAEGESEQQTSTLVEEIEAHEQTHAALQSAKEASEAANIAKSRYIAGLSHEIRAPLNSISGYAQLLERNPSVPADAIRVIRRSAEHLSSLVDGLLDISRIESGTLRLSRDKVRLVEFLDQVVDMFQPQAQAKNLAFIYEKPDHLPAYVYTDVKRLRQILLNLLSNAIKYTEEGHAALRVRYRSQVADIEISDTGLGIHPDDLETIFEPFERGQMPKARALPGTGLGLTITKLLTHVMGGEIIVESTLGVGSKFRVRLMLPEAMHSVDDVRLKPEIRGYNGRPITILLADDDLNHIDFVGQVLRPLGFTLLTARDGPSAIQLASEVAPHLAMLDISMPGLNGWEVAACLRNDISPTSKIIMISANAQDCRSSDAANHLHDAFCVKPLDVQQMLETIKSQLGIEWVFDDEDDKLAAVWRDKIPAGIGSHLDELLQLGRIGYVRGIEAKLKEWEAAEADAAAFIAHLRTLVRQFELKQFMEILRAVER
ncbi:MAG TPA: ATP-binding protein [Methylocella sp.]|nr:ATP-binding protein [Methylocella sp.]